MQSHFTKSSSSITIPFEGSDAVTGNFAAEVRDKAGQPVEGANVTLSLVDAAGTPVTNAEGNYIRCNNRRFDSSGRCSIKGSLC